MVNARSRFAEFLGRIGTGTLRHLSRLESRNILSPVVDWFKLGLLSLLVTLISACARRPGPIITCYKPASMLPVVTDVKIIPNPTQGADSVKFQATAQVYRPFLEGNYVTDAWAVVGDDTTYLPLKAVDGDFSNTMEKIEGYLDISKLEPCSTMVSLKVNTSKDGQVIHYYYLAVTEDTKEE